MANLTIIGLKNALNFIQENSREIKFHGKYKTDGAPDPKFGLIITPEGFSDDEAYHLRVVQTLTPKLFTRLAEDYTVLSLDGQELLHVLNDELYLSSLKSQIKSRGYTNASDVQVFKLLREKIVSDDSESLIGVVTDLLKDSIAGRGKLVIDAPHQELHLKAEQGPQLKTEQESDPSEAEKIIKQAKKEKQGA